MRTPTLATLAAIWLSFCSPLHAQWIRDNGPYGNVYCLALSPASGGSGANLYAGTSGNGVFLSTNNSQSWTQVNTGLTNESIGAITFSPDGTGGMNLFAGTDGGFFRSTNDGTSWTAAGLTYVSPQALAVVDTFLFAGTYVDGVFLSTNNGTSWTAVNTGLTGTSRYIVALFVSGTTLFAGTWGGGAFVSTNNGTSWNAANVGLTSVHVHAFTIFPASGGGGENLFAGTYGSGVFRSTNDGTSWTAAGLTNQNVRALAFFGTNLFAGTDGGGVFLSTNNGASWTAVSSGLTDSVVNALAVSPASGVSGAVLFAGTRDGVWRRALTEMITSAPATAEGGSPGIFELKQNYPNPFNPSTNIQYTLPHRAHVTLTVYNTLGQQVSQLVNADIDAGYHEVQFNASNLASGVYFYRIQAGSFVETKSLCILK